MSETLEYGLNRLAGTLSSGVPTLAASAAANVWAGTTDLNLVDALNAKAGNTLPNYLALSGVLNQLAGTTDLAPDDAVAAITGNLMANPSFTSGVAGWSYEGSGGTIAADSTDPHTAPNCLLATAGATDIYLLSPEMAVSAGNTYNISVWAKSTGVNDFGGYVYFRDASHAVLTNPLAITGTPLSSTWAQYSGSAVAPAGAAFLVINFKVLATDTNRYDDFLIS